MIGIVSILPAAAGGFAVIPVPAPDCWEPLRLPTFSAALGAGTRLAARLGCILIDGTKQVAPADCAALVSADTVRIATGDMNKLAGEIDALVAQLERTRA